MTARLYLDAELATAQVATGGHYILAGAAGHHASRVVRSAVGERIQVANGRGGYLTGVVAAVAAGVVEVAVHEVGQIPPPQQPITVVQALIKGEADQAVAMCTELGVDQVVPWQAERSVVRVSGPRAERLQAKWQAAAWAASEQSRRPWSPTVAPVVTTAHLADQIAQVSAAGMCVGVLAAGDDSMPLAGWVRTLVEPSGVWLVVGPEGGIGAAELQQLLDAGASAVRLGPHLVRAVTAGPAALAAIGTLTNWT